MEVFAPTWRAYDFACGVACAFAREFDYNMRLDLPDSERWGKHAHRMPFSPPDSDSDRIFVTNASTKFWPPARPPPRGLPAAGRLAASSHRGAPRGGRR